MDKNAILAMEAGEELDKLVAAEVMGEPIPEFTPENALGLQLAGSPVKSPKGNWLCLCRYDEDDIPTWRPLPYSTDISVAWLVVEKLIDIHPQGDFHLEHLEDEWCCGWCYPPSGADLDNWICGKTVPEAICKAALIATLVG